MHDSGQTGHEGGAGEEQGDAATRRARRRRDRTPARFPAVQGLRAETRHDGGAAPERRGRRREGLRGAGYIYAHGNGVVPDQETACKYWIAGAAIGDVECQGTLGARYCMGNGVPMDAAEGFRYYKMSADQGCVQGLNGMATCYENAEGVAQDLDEARRLLEVALDKVHADPAAAGGAKRAKVYHDDIMTALARIDSRRRGGMGAAFAVTGERRDGTGFAEVMPQMPY